jgi:hypothetical protein
VAADSLPDLRLQQRLRFGSEEDERRVDVVVEKRGPELVLVGLTPAGTRAFSLRLREGRLEIDRGVARWLDIDPVLVFDAVQRSRLVGFGEDSPGDGEHASAHGAEERTDTWRGGRRVARSFAAPGSPPSVRIEYRRAEGDPMGGAGTELIRVESEWCDYTARIATLAEERLP